MDLSVKLIIVGILFFAGSSFISFISRLRAKRDIDDDLILDMKESGSYMRKGDIKDKRLVKISVALYIIGLSFQIAGIILN